MRNFGFLILLSASLPACKNSSQKELAPAAHTTAQTTASVDTVTLSNQVYSSLAGGLSVREKPDAGAPVIGRIDYGAPVEMPPVPSDPAALPQNSSVPVTLGGMATYWVQAQVGGKTGYVIDAYVSDYPPPPAGTQDLKEWAGAMSKTYGAAFVSRSATKTFYQDGMDIYRQLYTNGVVFSEATGYEYICTSLQLPNTTVLKVLNCLRGLKDFKEIFKTDTPLQKGTYTVSDAALPEGYQWVTTYDPQGSFLQSVSISWSEGSFNTITITQLETEVVVSYSSGV